MSDEPNANTPLDCGDSSCQYATSRAGLRTNGGCRCLRDLSSVQRVRVSRYIAQLRARVAELEGDLAVAAGELLTPLPEPGTDMARLLSANVLLRRERDEVRARLAAVGGVVKQFEARAEANRAVGEIGRADAWQHAADLLEAALGVKP